MKKQFLFVALLAVFASGAVWAQNKSIVGKWKVAHVNVDGMNLDLENPASIKKMLQDQMGKESGKQVDSAQLQMIYGMFTSMFQNMRFEFTSGGQANFSVPVPGSEEVKSEVASYTVDYAKGSIDMTTKNGGKEKKDAIKFRFDGDYLVLEKGDKGETIKLKKTKE